MGVFERLRRKSRRTAEEATADGSPGAAEATSGTGADTDTVAGGDHATDGGTSAASESVDIPKQQTVDEAADNEAGEGARK